MIKSNNHRRLFFVKTEETCILCYKKNGEVSSARNTGIRKMQTDMVLVLDGDGKLESEYIEQVRDLLCKNPIMVAEYKLQLPDKAVLQKKLQELINMPLIKE